MKYCTISISLDLRGTPLPPIEIFDTAASRGVANDIFSGKSYPKVPIINDIRTVLDVGANVGLSAIWFSLLYPDCRVICAEPEPEIFAVLKRNVVHFPNINPHHIGLSDTTMSAQLATDNSGVGDTVVPIEGADKYYERGASIQLQDAEEFVTQNVTENIDILKIDTEGCEIQILQRLRHRLSSIKAIYVEYHRENDRRAIDTMLAKTHMLHAGHADGPSRGEFCFVNRSAYPDGFILAS